MFLMFRKIHRSIKMKTLSILLATTSIFALIALPKIHAQAPDVKIVTMGYNPATTTGSNTFSGKNTFNGPLVFGTNTVLITNPESWRAALQVTGSGTWQPGNISGIIMADGSNNISVAVPGVDYVTTGTGTIPAEHVTGLATSATGGALTVGGTNGTTFTLIHSGTAALVDGSATVLAPFITETSQVFYVPLSDAITAPIYTASVVSGTSFTVASGTASAAFSYLILNR